MADEHKSRGKDAARRIAEWLAQNEEGFKRDGVEEGSLAGAVGLPAEEVTEGVDYLENREEVVRFPHPLETPPRVVLKPGRGWRELRAEILGGASGG